MLKLKPHKSKKLNISGKLLRKLYLGTFPLRSHLNINKSFDVTETILPRSSFLKFRKRFQIKSPLKPTLKFVQKPRHKRRYQSTKRAIYRNEKLNKKYLPLLRSLSELFDNMLPSDSGESGDSERSQIKLRRNKNKDENESSCTCNQKSKAASTKSTKETIAPTTISTKKSTITEVADTPTEISSTTPDTPADNDISDLGSNSDVSILLTRDTYSSGRDDSRLSEGSSSTHHTSSEGNIARHNGNSERDTAHGEDRSSSKNYEATPYSDTRNYASGSGFEVERVFDGRRGLHGDRDDTRSPVYRKAQETNEKLKNKDAVRYFRGDIAKSKGETELEMGRDEAKSTTFIPQFIPGFRGFVPFSEIGQKSQSIQTKEIYEKSIIGISDDNSSDKGIFNGNSTYTTENKKAGEANATVISVKELTNPIIMLQSPKHNAPYVTIFDGYSVARDKNGSNKLPEQSIRYHS